MSKCHIVGNHMSRLKWVTCISNQEWFLFDQPNLCLACDHFPHIMSLGSFGCHCNPCFWPFCHKTIYINVQNQGGGGGGGGGTDPPEKSQKYRVSKQYWSGSPEKSQSHQASIQCWANNGMPAKRHLNGNWLASGWWLAYSGIWILPPLIN